MNNPSYTSIYTGVGINIRPTQTRVESKSFPESCRNTRQGVKNKI